MRSLISLNAYIRRRWGWILGASKAKVTGLNLMEKGKGGQALAGMRAHLQEACREHFPGHRPREGGGPKKGRRACRQQPQLTALGRTSDAGAFSGGPGLAPLTLASHWLWLPLLPVVCHGVKERSSSESSLQRGWQPWPVIWWGAGVESPSPLKEGWVAHCGVPYGDLAVCHCHVLRNLLSGQNAYLEVGYVFSRMTERVLQPVRQEASSKTVGRRQSSLEEGVASIRILVVPNGTRSRPSCA